MTAPRGTLPICIAGHEDYDALFSEVIKFVAELVPHEQAAISVELCRLSVPHFSYQGILVMRAAGIEQGYIFL